MPLKLDPLDRRILALVQRDCTLAAETIAEQVGLSASAVQRRLKRMREDKTILAQVAVVDPKRVGRPLTFIAAAEIERERAELLQELRRWLDAEPAVPQVYYVTGTADLVMILTAESVEAYDAITARLVAENPNVRRVTTSVTLHAFKRGLFVPVGGDS
jgi:Lrp/AsnC family leucine-responsive transcriptional regulator